MTLQVILLCICYDLDCLQSDINKYNLLSPLLVITTLAHNSNSTLAIVKVMTDHGNVHIHAVCNNVSLCIVVHLRFKQITDIFLFQPLAPSPHPMKEYITNRLQKESDQVTEDARLIKQYKDETEKMKQQIEQLKTR